MKPFQELKKMIADKKEWRQQMQRVKALPEDYQVVYKEIEKYLFSLASGSGLDTVAGLYQLIDFFEEGAAQGLAVLDYVGEDVGQFAEDYRRSLATDSWVEDQQHKLQSRIESKQNKLK